jgi:hypothetical protein
MSGILTDYLEMVHFEPPKRKSEITTGLFNFVPPRVRHVIFRADIAGGKRTMNLLRKFWQGFSGSGSSSGDVGLYYYVRCDRCSEVIRVRINPLNDLSYDDSGKSLWSHKIIVGQRCYNRIEADFIYDTGRKLRSSLATGGTFVDKKAYQADQEAHPQKAPTG